MNRYFISCWEGEGGRERRKDSPRMASKIKWEKGGDRNWWRKEGRKEWQAVFLFVGDTRWWNMDTIWSEEGNDSEKNGSVWWRIGLYGYSFSGKDSPKSMDFLWIFMDILWTLWIIFSRRLRIACLKLNYFGKHLWPQKFCFTLFLAVIAYYNV